ncbi:unnamed protein product [Bursaphelenchus okinawaensis]|uniref:Phospholipid/glycerol acyltransferase domain-containing protein n=1 Tax=Bursaphelenchus okinawaensis TaxID=465554 RepID=A0A811KH47_9BILA|nr:unnamed protein product [Bursaphelenchus okinawaensis]CAG9103212.1 unnamed protein product [Bursaphelenchus okinawaensis]
MVEYVDWLGKVASDGGELAWITRTKAFDAKSHQRSRYNLLNYVLSSDKVKNAINETVKETGRTYDNVSAEAKEILDNMAHDFNLTATRAIGYPVLKVIKILFDKIFVNMEALKQLKTICNQDSVVFVPTHRTYVDFLLISLICFEANITLPAICAGSDFQSSRLVGESLRKAGAFFIRREFGNDNLYWAVFSEYVQAHIINNERPVEFFPEGQRSRVSKTLNPKTGLLKVVAEPFIRNQVYDTVLVPVTMNYDRLLETVLYSRELLGSPKPKENVSGVLKVRNILHQNFGNVFVTFGTPISLRQTMAINRAELSFGPSSEFKFTNPMKNSVQQLADYVVNEHNKNNVLTVWSFMTPVIRLEIDKKGYANLGDLFEKVEKLVALCKAFGITVKQQLNLTEEINYYLKIYADVIDNENGKIRLKEVPAEKSKELSVDVLQKAIPAIVLLNSSNAAAFSLFNIALILLICNSNNKIKSEELFYRFKKTKYIFNKEFVMSVGLDNVAFKDAMDKLYQSGILSLDGDSIRIVKDEVASMITSPVEPYITAYNNIMCRVRKTGNLTVQECRKQLVPFCSRCSDYLHLSSAVIRNVLHLKTKNPEEFGNFQVEVEKLLSPQPDLIRSRL